MSYNNRIIQLYRGTCLLVSLTLFLSINAIAQKDTTRQSISIVSSYKPSIKPVAKINFSGSQLTADTSRNVRQYNVPSQNLFYSYQAIPITALELTSDTSLDLGNRNFIKAGYGNYSTPFLSAGLGIGDGNTGLVNIYANYISQVGKLRYQDYSLFNVKATGSYFAKKNEVYASVTAARDQRYLYGFDNGLVGIKREDVRQQFQQFSIATGIKNTASYNNGFDYNPNLQVHFFSNKSILTENTVIFNLPAEIKISDNFSGKLELSTDITSYKSEVTGINSYDNNVSQIAPAVVYNSESLMIQGGITPTFDNDEFKLLPNVMAELKLKEQKFILQAGWVGRVVKNTFRNLSQINPFLAPMASQLNTTETEFYGGIKTSIGKHFKLNAKAGVVAYKDFALFINKQSPEGINSFVISNEPAMENFRIHGDISYINQEKFTATAGITLNGFTGVNVNDKAYNTLPMEFTGSLRWWAFDRVLLKGDFYFFAGYNYLQGGVSQSMSGGSDISAGAEIKISRNFSAFLDVNNIFNDKYQRWHNYEVLGLNFVGGVVVHF